MYNVGQYVSLFKHSSTPQPTVLQVQILISIKGSLTKYAHVQCGFFFKVTKGELPPIPQHLKSETKDFIQQCLRVKPEERPSARELLEHPFVSNAPPTFAAAASASGLWHDMLL
jgi:serine/threonine protein kinase